MATTEILDVYSSETTQRQSAAFLIPQDILHWSQRYWLKVDDLLPDGTAQLAQAADNWLSYDQSCVSMVSLDARDWQDGRFEWQLSQTGKEPRTLGANLPPMGPEKDESYETARRELLRPSARTIYQLVTAPKQLEGREFQLNAQGRVMSARQLDMDDDEELIGLVFSRMVEIVDNPAHKQDRERRRQQMEAARNRHTHFCLSGEVVSGSGEAKKVTRLHHGTLAFDKKAEELEKASDRYRFIATSLFRRPPAVPPTRRG